MKLKVRPETIQDYNVLANLNYAAFLYCHDNHPYVSEPPLVAATRQCSSFDPALSLVAEANGDVIGHAMYVPFRFQVKGQEVNGSMLAPLAVLPGHQKRGVGKLLMEEGEKLLLEKGIPFCLLAGIPTYYPRYGYLNRMYSLNGVKATFDTTTNPNLWLVSPSLITNTFIKDSFEASGKSDINLLEQHPETSDAGLLVKWWERQNKDASLALCPGESITDWVSLSPNCQARMIFLGDTPIGYVRNSVIHPERVRELLAADAESYRLIAATLAKSCGGTLHLPLTPKQAGQYGLIFESEVKAVDPFMIKVLDPSCQPIVDYCAEVQSDKSPVGVISFPSIYDVDEFVSDRGNSEH